MLNQPYVMPNSDLIPMYVAPIVPQLSYYVTLTIILMPATNLMIQLFRLNTTNYPITSNSTEFINVLFVCSVFQ